MNKVPELISAADRRDRIDPVLYAKVHLALTALINGDTALPNTWDTSSTTGQDEYIPEGTYRALVAWLGGKGYFLLQKQRTERRGNGYGGDPFESHVWTLTVSYK